MNELAFDDIEIGMRVSFKKMITKEMEDSFRVITGDDNPLHKEDAFAVELGGAFKSHIVFGMLTASFLSTMAGMYLPGKYSLIHSIDCIKFKNPVSVGDILEVMGEVIDKNEGLNLIILKIKMINQNKKVVLTANMKVLVQKNNKKGEE